MIKIKENRLNVFTTPSLCEDRSGLVCSRLMNNFNYEISPQRKKEERNYKQWIINALKIG